QSGGEIRSRRARAVRRGRCRGRRIRQSRRGPIGFDPGPGRREGRTALAWSSVDRASSPTMVTVKIVRRPVLLLAFMSAVVIAWCQSSDAAAFDWEGRAVGRIVFDPPNQPFLIDELQKLLPFGVGSTLSRADVRTAIQKLYL